MLILPMAARPFWGFSGNKVLRRAGIRVCPAFIIMAGILMSLHIYFQPTSLFNTLMMLTLLFGGLGLIFRSLKAMPATPDDNAPSTATAGSGPKAQV